MQSRHRPRYIPLMSILLLAVALALSACGSAAADTIVAPESVQPTAEIHPTQASNPDSEVEVSVDNTTSECVDCHTDKQRLIDTAKPEEEHTSESSGVG